MKRMRNEAEKARWLKKIMKLRENGFTIREIVIKTGLSDTTIYKITKGQNTRKTKRKKKPYLIYASYTLNGQECLVEWTISEHNKTAAMNRAMGRMGSVGGENRHIGKVQEMTPEFIKKEKKMNRQRELCENAEYEKIEK